MVKMSLEKLQLEADPGSIDYSDERYMTVQNLFKIENKINDLIDLVNSQQEAIERLQEHVDHEARHVSEPADDKPRISFSDEIVPAFSEEVMEELERRDTHRTVTLRIPKGMRVGEAIRQVWMEAANSGYLGSVSDTDLQKALDEVKGESNE